MTNAEVVNVVPTNKVEYSTGEVAVKKGSGVVKVRKGQTEEAYIEQRDMFWKSGPVISTENCLIDHLSQFLTKSSKDVESFSHPKEGVNDIAAAIQNLDLSDERSYVEQLDKIDRELIIRGLERLYYTRDYDQCIAYTSILTQDLSKIDLSTKQGKVFNRNVKDVNQIHQLCLKKLETSRDSEKESL